MKEDLLKDFRNEYIKRLKEKQNNDNILSTLMNRKKFLENSPLVRDYIELCNQIQKFEDKIFTEDEIFTYTLFEYENMGLTSETNKIYFYAGTFLTENGEVKRVERNSSTGEFDKYIDIESIQILEVPIEDRDVFEKSNRVVDLNVDFDKYLFYDVRDEFINDCLNYGQEVACKKILSKNKKNL